MRIIIVTAGCDRHGFSETLVGYRWVSRLSERHEVTLLNYRRRAESPVAPHLPGTRVVEWVEPPGLERVERFNTMARPSYPWFLVRARAWIDRAVARGERFDVGLQPVPVALRYPSPLTGTGVPYVLGPLGGSLDDPPGFGSEDTSPWFVGLRRLDDLRLRHDPVLRRSFSQAACVIGIADYVGDLLGPVPLRRYESMPDTALDALPVPEPRPADHGADAPVRLLFVGRVVRTKGVRDAVRAMAHLRDLPVVLDVVGDGHDREHCEEVARELGLEGRVVFHGMQSRTEVDRFYRRADVFVFPSYREAGGTVTFEALGHGLPMIVADRGGPAFAVDDTCGVRVTPTSPEDYAQQIAAAVRPMVEDPALRQRLSVGARARAEAIGTWDRRIERMESILTDAAAEGPAARRRG